MTLSKNYNGYKSFSYLDSQKDYREYKLVSQTSRVKSTQISLDKSEEERVSQIFEKYIMISTHDHPFLMPEDLDQTMDYIKRNRISTGYEGLANSGLDGIFDGLLNSFNLINSSYPWKWDSVINEIGMKLTDIAHQDYAMKAEKTEDIINAHKNGNIAIIMHLEGASMIENDLDRLDILHGLGVRCMGVVYSEANMLGSGLKESRDGGLTVLGHEAVGRMNKVGITVDIAHVADQTCMDIIETSTKPVMATHAGVRSLWNTKRMKPDEVLKAMAEKGGVLGIEAAPHTTLTERQKVHSIEPVMEHFEKAVETMGIDHVAFGPDTMFGDHVGMHHKFERELGIAQAHKGMNFNEVDFVDGIENPSDFKNIIRWLVKHGYSDQEIEKVSGANVMRVLRSTWVK